MSEPAPPQTRTRWARRVFGAHPWAGPRSELLKVAANFLVWRVGLPEARLRGGERSFDRVAPEETKYHAERSKKDQPDEAEQDRRGHAAENQSQAHPAGEEPSSQAGKERQEREGEGSRDYSPGRSVVVPHQIQEERERHTTDGEDQPEVTQLGRGRLLLEIGKRPHVSVELELREVAARVGGQDLRWLIGFDEEKVLQNQGVHLRAEEAVQRLFGTADDRLSAHVEAGVDDHGTAGLFGESLEQPIVAAVPFF